MFDPAKAEQITSRLSAGEPMAQICRDPNLPSVTTIWTWQQQNPSFSESIARAREAGFDVIAAEALTIADDVPADSDEVQRARLRVDTRLKLLSKWDSKRYGDRVQVDADMRIEVTVNDPFAPVQAAAAVAQAAASVRLADAMVTMAGNAAQAPGTPPLHVEASAGTGMQFLPTPADVPRGASQGTGDIRTDTVRISPRTGKPVRRYTHRT